MRNLFVVLTVAAFGLAALPADALTVKKGAEKVAAEGKGQESRQGGTRGKGQEGRSPQKGPKVARSVLSSAG
jgi:hypothetical protein